MFPQCSIYYTSNTSIEEEHQVFFRSVVNFPENYQRYCARFPIPPIFTVRNSWIFGASKGSALGDLTSPTGGKGNDLCMSVWHHSKPNKLLVVVVWWGGHMKFLQTEREDQQFFAASRGIKNLTESFIQFLPPSPPPLPRELKNDNSQSTKFW